MKSDKYLDNKIFFLDFYAIPKGKYLRGNLVKMERNRNFAVAKCQRTQ